MKVLTFGGAGFLGSSLDKEFKKNNIENFVYDNLLTGKRENIDIKTHFINGDISDIKQIEKHFLSIKPEIVIHLAAIHHIPTAESNPLNTIETNLKGTSNILEILSKNNFQGRFGFASTGGIYKDIGKNPLTENSEIDPIGIYPLSKYFSEKIIDYYVKSGKANFKTTNFRLFNLVGKSETNDHLLPAILKQIYKGDNVSHGNLKPYRDYVHVDDVSSLITLWILDKSSKPIPQNMNICSGKHFSVNEVINICAKVTNKEIRLIFDEKRARKTDRLFQLGSNQLAKNRYSWNLKKDLKIGIKDLWDDILSHQ